MRTIKLRNNTVMPAFGLGTWKSAPGDVIQAVLEAVRAGYRHIDCASIYENEPEVGQALAQLFSEGTVQRSELWITSKLWSDRHAPEDVEAALQESLRHLQLDYLDQYLIHWPVSLKRGVLAPSKVDDMISPAALPIAETWGAMEKQVDKGLVKSIGVSNFSVDKLKTLMNSSTIKPALNQVELHPYLQQNKMLDYCQRESVALTAYSPLGSRDRAPQMKAANEPDLLTDPKIAAIANKHQATSAQVLIAWALSRGTAVIPKSVKPNRIRENLQACTLELDNEDMSRIASLDKHRRYVDGKFWALPNGPYTLENLWDE